MSCSQKIDLIEYEDKIDADPRIKRLNRWRPQIERALKKGGGVLTYSTIVEDILRNATFLFENETAFSIVEPQEWPTGVVVHILVGGGDQEGLYRLEDAVTIFAKLIEARKITIHGRVGFKKRLAPGWKTTMHVYEKEL
jgi:hypothetical protein